MVRTINFSYNEFSQNLQDFADLVIDKCYDKMPYSIWKTINKARPANTNVFCKWSKYAIDITFGDELEYHHFCFGDNSFGDFLRERILPIETYIIDDHNALSKIRATINEVYENNTKNDSINDKENEKMKGFNFDFGPVNGNAVHMSMYGLAVKNKVGAWVSYDVKSGEVMDVDILNFDGAANFLYKMPVAMKNITVGDVVIHHGAPMFVVGKSTDAKGLVVVDVIAGERKEIMLAKSPFGFNFATKVVNFLDGAMGNMKATADNPFGNMWMLMAMSDNKNMSDMLPFMMMANGGNMDPAMMMCMAMSGKSGDINPMMMMVMMNMSAPVAAPAHECKCGGNCGNHHE